MKTEQFTYTYENTNFLVFINYKTQKNIYYRLKNDGFHISAPYFVSTKKIISGLNKFAPNLIKSFNKITSNYSFEEDSIFLLGKKYSMTELDIKGEEELQFFLKKKALEVLTRLTRKYEEIMSIKNPYKVNVRKTTTRFGSNSLQTHSISYQINLIHFSEDIISTVVVHELAHDFYRNHQKDFYNCVYYYCPFYKQLQRKLKTGIHE